MTDNPRWARLPAPKDKLSGLSRGKLYQIAAENPGLFKKAGTATIVDLHMLDRVIAELPDAQHRHRISRRNTAA